MTPFFIFTRRTPRALNYHPTTTVPRYVRKAGTSSRTIRSMQMTQDNKSHDIARGVIASMKRRTNRRTLTVDLEQVVREAKFDDIQLIHVAETAGIREHIRIEEIK